MNLIINNINNFIKMETNRNEYVALYDKYCAFSEFDFNNEELSKIVLGSFTKNNKNLENLNDEKVIFEILDIMCMKLITIPKFSLHIRMAMENLETIKELLLDKKVGIYQTLMIFFTKEELNACII
jgi:hypothetical protein